MKLFEYAVLFHPKKKKDQEQEASQIILEPTWKLARDDKEVAIHAARAIPDGFMDKLDQVEIIVRPFVA